MILDDYIRLVGMPTGGAVRVSLGLATNFADVHRFMDFATEFRDVTEVPADLPPRAGLLDAGRQPGVRAERLPQRRHEVAVDHVEEHVRTGVSPLKSRSNGSRGSTSRSVRSRVVAVTGDGPPSIRLSYPNACPGPARPTRMRRPPRTMTFSTAPFIVT